MVTYDLKEIHPEIFALKIENGYERAMLFMRSQEHYESPFPEIKGKHFDIFKFMDIYRKWKGREYFSYPNDWAGFNVPGHIVESCTEYVLDVRNGIFPTEYDYIMDSIIKTIKRQIGPDKRYYLIGSNSFEGKIISHEIAHGLYYVNPDFKTEALDLVNKLPKSIRKEMHKILTDMGYSEEVIDDEIQAYMSVWLTYEMTKIKSIGKYKKSFEKNLEKHRGISKSQ